MKSTKAYFEFFALTNNITCECVKTKVEIVVAGIMLACFFLGTFAYSFVLYCLILTLAMDFFADRRRSWKKRMKLL